MLKLWALVFFKEIHVNSFIIVLRDNEAETLFVIFITTWEVIQTLLFDAMLRPSFLFINGLKFQYHFRLSGTYYWTFFRFPLPELASFYDVYFVFLFCFVLFFLFFFFNSSLNDDILSQYMILKALCNNTVVFQIAFSHGTSKEENNN